MSKKMSRYPSDCKVYVGDLGNNARKNEIEESFGYYGQLRNVWIARNPPGFAFVEFEDPRDAEDAVHGLDGRTVCGRRARVELSSGKTGRGFRGQTSRSRGRPFHPDDRCYECGDRGHYARDCRKHGGRTRSRRSRSRSSRSRERKSTSRSRSASRSRSRSRSRSPRSSSHARDSRGSRTTARTRSKSIEQFQRHSSSSPPSPPPPPPSSSSAANRRSNSRGDSKSPKHSGSRSITPKSLRSRSRNDD